MKFNYSTSTSCSDSSSVVLHQSNTANYNVFDSVIVDNSIEQPNFAYYHQILMTAKDPNFSEVFILSDNEVIELEKKMYENKKNDYLKKYEGQYIALFNGNVLDSDKDFSNLAKRVYEKNEYRPVFIPHVINDSKKHRVSPRFKSLK